MDFCPGCFYLQANICRLHLRGVNGTFFYFLLTQGANVQKASINVLFSPQAFLYNKEFGNFKDIALLKTFLFDWGIYTGNNHFSNILAPFITHLQSPYVLMTGFL